MAIKRVSISNISVFKKLELETCSGINVIVGENGAGKTHLLKMIYYTYRQRGWAMLEKKYIRQYDDRKEYAPVVNLEYEDGNKVDTCWLQLDGVKHATTNNEMVYIPVTDMLSHSKGFLALSQKYDLPFDKTEVDIVSHAELPETKQVTDLNKSILQILSGIIEGQVIYEEDTFYIQKSDGIKVEFSLEAEGIRKFGLLWRLIRNGMIAKDSILLWDEPEASINPSLFPTLVEILITLQREGVQIFVSTHSYNFAKYFEVKKVEEDCIKFHNMKENETFVDTEDYFGKLENNKIIEADEHLLDEVFERNLED